MNLTLLVVVALLVINLLLLVWLLKRPVSSPDQALALLSQELQSHADARQAQTERDLREVREELQRSASGTRQELTQSLGQAIGLFQQTVLGQQGDATRTQNEQLDSFRVQLAAMQQALADALRDSSHQAGLQASAQREAQALALARSTEVWQVLGAVKTEFAKFGDVLAKTRKKLDEASRVMDDADRRARVMTKALRDVVALPDKQAQALLPGQESALDEADADPLV